MAVPRYMMLRFSALSNQLPDDSIREMDFRESSFFKEPGKCLPTPAQVKALSSDVHISPQPQPVIFNDSKLFVKFGPDVTIAEARCLWMIKRAFSDAVSVTEVFGWRVDEENNIFIYVELIEGMTLHDRWSDLNGLDKKFLCDQLSQIINNLCSLEQDPSDQ